MGHKFYKYGEAGLPSRIGSKVWEKLGKFTREAHDVWDMTAEDDDIVAVRKKDDNVKLNYKQNDIQPQDLVILFMGGGKHAAHVLEDNDGILILRTVKTGAIIEEVPKEWVRKVQGQITDEQIQRSRKPTREDIPMQQPQERQLLQDQPQLNPQQAEVAKNLAALLQSKNGQVAVQLSPSTILELKSTGTGVQAQVWEVSTRLADTRNHQSIEALVQSMGLEENPPETPLPSATQIKQT